MTLFILTCSPLTGCAPLHEYRPMRVMVRDAETKEALGSVEIRGWYDRMLDVFGPAPPNGVTSPDGVATLQIGPDRSFNLRVEEPGYLMTDAREGLTPEYVRRLPKKGHPNAGDVDLVIDLPPDPRPTFVLVVPDNYRGLLRVRFEADENATVTPQRTYPVPVGPDGRAVVRLPRAVWDSKDGRNVSAREGGGKRVPWDSTVNSEEVRLRHVCHTEDTELYLIGTGPECEALYDKVRPRTPGGERKLDTLRYATLLGK